MHTEQTTLVPREKLAQRVLRIFAARIVNGDQDGVELPTEAEICAEFGVSKTVAREVISHLEVMGLVAVRHGRRMERQPASEWDYLDPLLVELISDRDEIRRVLDELYEVRILIEPEVAAWAAVRATPVQREELTAMAAALEAAVSEPEFYVELDERFHSALVTIVGNRILSQVVRSMFALRQASRKRSNRLPWVIERATRDHVAIGEAVVRGDADTARAAMQEHLNWSPLGWASAEATDADSQSER